MLWWLFYGLVYLASLCCLCLCMAVSFLGLGKILLKIWSMPLVWDSIPSYTYKSYVWFFSWFTFPVCSFLVDLLLNCSILHFSLSPLQPFYLLIKFSSCPGMSPSFPSALRLCFLGHLLRYFFLALQKLVTSTWQSPSLQAERSLGCYISSQLMKPSRCFLFSRGSLCNQFWIFSLHI